MSRCLLLVVLAVYALPVLLVAEDHNALRNQPGRAVQDDVSVSTKLSKFIEDEFNLHADFVKRTYAPRVTQALKEMNEGDKRGLVDVSTFLLSRLSDGKKIILDAKMQELKGGEKSDADLDDLIQALQTLRRDNGEGAAGKGEARFLARNTGGPSTVQDFMNLIKKEHRSIRDRYGCYKRCENFRDRDLTDSVCYQSCQYAFPQN